MESVINAALVEICTQAQDGLTLAALWLKLQPSLSSVNLDLSAGVKGAVWANLLRIPTLLFEGPKGSCSADDSSIQTFEDAEKLNLKIVAQESLRDSFFGLYNVQSANARLSNNQRSVLKMLADAREKGITQSQLSKKLGIKENNVFYVLKSLDCQGLIVKQSALERKKDNCPDRESKYYPCVTTNLIYLNRYAKQLGSHQRVEIIKWEQNLEGPDEANGNDSRGDVDVLVKDYTLQMKAISDKLEKANNKVLLVSDIKKDLGYRGSRSRQKAWREIFRRLIADHIVEQFDAKVDGKVEACLRLLKPITAAAENDDENFKYGKKVQVIDQVVELPPEHQIFDMIDAAGSDGIVLKEICERLGFDLKKTHPRLINMCHGFGMKAQDGQLNKTKAYRLWTSKNFNPEPEVKLICKPDKNNLLDHHVSNSSGKELPDSNALPSNVDPVDPRNMEDRETDAVLSCGSSGNIESISAGTPMNFQELVLDPRSTVSNSKHDLVWSAAERDVAPSGVLLSDVLRTPCIGSYQRFPNLTGDGTKRAIKIIERLEDEKIILRSEMPRWLASFEKDKSKTIDRKTVDRILNELQKQGLCKCIAISVPVITDCSKNRTQHVVMHPSMNLSPELVDEIQKRVRQFDMESRKQGLSRRKDDGKIPVIENIQKTHNHINADERAGKAEAMRANGFILAKMIRAKLLHSFLWDFLHSSHNEASSSELCIYEHSNPHSSSKLFSLEAAIKEIPIELFLQVVGSTKKYEEMIEKCKMGLRLSDLSPQEYKCLMDTHATGRLSLVVDILRRLKLIRMATGMQSRAEVEISHHSLTHIMELKPYIEEPISNYAASSNFKSIDLRPRIRHDFLLSSRDAVDDYWRTLEYCYAAADPTAAFFSFPGSVVPEVFRYRSWASTRLMTSEQRGELLKHVAMDNLSEKISYKDCEKIAKDLNLNLEQVLSMYSSKRRHCLNQFKDEGSHGHLPRQKRNAYYLIGKNSKESRPAKCARIDAATEIVGSHTEEQDASDTAYGDHATHLQESQDDDDQYETEDSGLDENENGDSHPLIHQCILSKNKPTRQRRFLWSDETDRKLVIQYVKRRVTLGTKYHRIDWASLPDLPAPPGTCKKRMALLNSNSRFRKSLMRLCNMIAERYAKHLEKTQNMSLNNGDCRQFVRSPSRKGVDVRHNGETQEITIDEESWDDFENENIKIALDEVLRCKKIAKLEASKKDFNETEIISSSIPGKIVQSHRRKHHEFSSHRSRRHRLDKKFTRFLNNVASVSREVYESLAVSNAVELFKLVFLSTSTGPQAPNLLADILRRYSEHDLFAAFNYLREKKVMIGGNGNQPFELSQPFLNSVSKSVFPPDTGKGAVNFSTWLHGKGKDLSEGGKNLPEDLQCGEIFHLFALVSSGEFSISPCLPDNGIGEAEDLRNTKRKSNITESASGDRAKKLKLLEGEIISRREKGFPGIILSVHRATIPTADTIDLFKDNYGHNSDRHLMGNSELDTDQRCDDFNSHHMLEILNSTDRVHIDKDHIESPWEAMAGYARHLMSLPYNQEQYGAICAELFKVVYAAIQKAGDQGLSMEEVSQVINMPEIEVDGLIVDVLQAFGQALKVNAYDSVHVVDALYRHKYFLTSVSGFHQGVQPTSSTKTMAKNDEPCKLYQPEEYNFNHTNLLRERSGVDNVHKVTILNLPQENMDPEKISSNLPRNNVGVQDKFVSPILEKETLESCNSEMCIPILPWINGDGTINNIVYKGLRRRVLGIVMQSPGILEGDIILQMDALNPQSCKTLLELMVLDKHLLKRKMHQHTSDGAPSMLQNLIGKKFSQPKLICREHFIANPMSTSLL